MTKRHAHEIVADSLRTHILEGRYKPGQRLPSEEALTDEYGVSRNTVRVALNHLAAANLITRRRGSGSYVNSDLGISHSLGNLRSFTVLLRDLGLQPGITEVEVRLDPNPPLEILGFLPSEVAWLVRRVRTGSGSPFALLDSWLPDRIGSRIDPEALTRRQSLYASLAEDLDIKVAEATESIHAEAADEREARVLDVPVGSPIIVIRRWTYDRAGRPVEYTRSAARGDRYRYVVKLRA
ncbi:GntR family transcriptional regulator [Nonomuraea diastatica]|uniref:GntR family transcriptional regulator n=1 Tax=Nonomuraea diastatica TaxID=1848329 RepID=A0A4R4VVH4_9ACTN|nr:GntR family transcriptional regulator [Nonomuraea diastatica]TDD10012.1 GntR family transcriptional regulator [Nonomuraea diastatica]